MTIVGANLCVCVKWLRQADMAEGPHTSCLAAHASLFFLFPWLSFSFLPFSSPFLSFLSFLSFCVSFFPYPCTHLPSLLSASFAHSFSLLFRYPSLSLWLYAQGKGLSLYHRVEPLSCSHFIHMETRASLLFSLLLLDTHTQDCTHETHSIILRRDPPPLSTCCYKLIL